MVPVPADGALAYGDAFDFDVAAGHAGELRVQLFKKHASALAPNAKTVVANAGVYVKNIVSHIAAHGDIDKDFKLFSKGGEASGGFVRLRVAFEEDAAAETPATMWSALSPPLRRGRAATKTPTRRILRKRRKKRRRRSRRAGRGKKPATTLFVPEGKTTTRRRTRVLTPRPSPRRAESWRWRRSPPPLA